MYRFNSERWITFGFNLNYAMSWFVSPFYFNFLSILNLKIKRVTPLLSLGITNPFSEDFQTRESLKRPYFPLPLSILASSNLIIFFVLQPSFDSQENPSPIRFPGKFILWFPRKSMPNPQGKPKRLLFFLFAPSVFWICSRGRFAFVPLDLNFTNPKSTIFEPGWETQPLPANHDQITK